MLGAPQLGKLLQDLAAAEAAGVTWKFLMTSMPMQNFGPLAGEDRWEGYAAERAFLLSQIAALGIKNVVFVTADFHGTIVNDITVPNPSNPTQQLFTGAFEIITGSVAYSAPAGPTFAQLGVSTGAITPAQFAFYQSLPNAGKDAFIQSVLDGVISGYGYSPTGIQDPSINATFITSRRKFKRQFLTKPSRTVRLFTFVLIFTFRLKNHCFTTSQLLDNFKWDFF
jgi:hypothetical protein